MVVHFIVSDVFGAKFLEEGWEEGGKEVVGFFVEFALFWGEIFCVHRVDENAGHVIVAEVAPHLLVDGERTVFFEG